jgi:hypothetical protein
LTFVSEMCSLSDTWVSVSQQALTQRCLASLRGTADGRWMVASSAFGALCAPFDRFAPQWLPHNAMIIPIDVYALLHMSLYEHRLFIFCAYLTNFRQRTSTSPANPESALPTLAVPPSPETDFDGALIHVWANSCPPRPRLASLGGSRTTTMPGAPPIWKAPATGGLRQPGMEMDGR